MRDNPREVLPLKPFAQPALVLALSAFSAGCGAASDVLYVGSALGEAGPPEAGVPVETGSPPPIDSGGTADVPTSIDAPGPGPFDAVCTPAVDFQNLDPAGGGKVFTDNVKNATDFVQTLARKVCSILYRSPPEVPPIARITLVIQPIANISPTIGGTASGNTANFNSNYFVAFANSHTPDDVLYELSGIGAHLISFMYERGPAPTGVLSGINDFVRYRAGYTRDSLRRKGGNWDDGYMTTGFFFAYLDDEYPNFVYRLNLVDGTGYNVTAFQVFTGKDVLTLWNEYQGTL
jgi:hypothetical protein